MPNRKSAPVRVAIVEDDPLMLESLELNLRGHKNIALVATYGTAEEALGGLPLAMPDILLVDLGLPGIGGVELIGRVREKHSGVLVMVLTTSSSRKDVFEALKAGASGYLLKKDDADNIAESILELRRGGAPMSREIARAVVQEFHPSVEVGAIFSPRELQVLKCLAEGMTYKEIASDLKISWHTVHAFIKKIYDKLHANGRHDALKKAKERGAIR